VLGKSYSGLVSLLGIAGEIKGRKKLQKVVYLAKKAGFPGLNQSFDYHWYGPYSDALTAEINELVLLGGVSEEKQQTSGGYATYSYTLTKKVRDYFADDIQAARPFQPGIELLVKEDARFLELAATIHFFMQSGYDREDALQEVRARKSDQKYSESECRKALRFLEDLVETFPKDEISLSYQAKS